MVAVVKTSTNVRNALHYNEHKVRNNQAQLIHSSGFAKDTDQLGFTDKVRRFEKLTELNERTQVNTLHISLNFDPSEHPDAATLQRIADGYMQKMGFGDQPYLVYQHNDAGHDHIHIVTVNIKTDGRAINLHNIGRNQSTKARKEIEREFKLVIADAKQEKQVKEIRPVTVQKVQYGKHSTKRAITNVLDAVLAQYKYSSLEELNAILKQYNVVADRGGNDSRTYQRGGLVFRVLDKDGNKISAPIKASDFYSQPTLKNLEKLFTKNEPLKQPHKQRVRNTVERVLRQMNGGSLQELEAALLKDRIQLVVRRGKDGVVYGLTYIDYSTKTVFNGSDLGNYSAKKVLERLGQQQLPERVKPEQVQKQPTTPDKLPGTSKQEQPSLPKSTQKPTKKEKPKPAMDANQKEPRLTPSLEPSAGPSIGTGLQDILFQESSGGLNSELKKANKKKRRKRLRH